MTNKIFLSLIVTGAVGLYVGYRLGVESMWRAYGNVLSAEAMMFLAAMDHVGDEEDDE